MTNHVSPPQRATAPTSAMARAFAAQVQLKQEGVSFFLVVGREGWPDAAVARYGGKIAVRFGDQRRVIALLALVNGSALQRAPEVALAGPVTLDVERFVRCVRPAP